MTHHAILTALGTDRPGLVDEVSQFIFQHGGNIEDSRMLNLRGQFAIGPGKGDKYNIRIRIFTFSFPPLAPFCSLVRPNPDDCF